MVTAIAAGPDLGGDPLGALGVEVGDDDFRALLGKAPRHAFAEAGSGAGDDRNLVLETHVSRLTHD